MWSCMRGFSEAQRQQPESSMSTSDAGSNLNGARPACRSAYFPPPQVAMPEMIDTSGHTADELAHVCEEWTRPSEVVVSPTRTHVNVLGDVVEPAVHRAVKRPIASAADAGVVEAVPSQQIGPGGPPETGREALRAYFSASVTLRRRADRVGVDDRQYPPAVRAVGASAAYVDRGVALDVVRRFE